MQPESHLCAFFCDVAARRRHLKEREAQNQVLLNYSNSNDI